MNFRHPVYRLLAVYLIVAMASFAPIASFQQAVQALGLKTVLLGGLVGGAALLALGALAGPASAIGAAGCAGTGFLGTLGGAIGACVSGVTGICVAMGTMAASSLATMGLMVGGALLGVIGLCSTPWLIIPALAIGVGLMVYAWSKNRYGTSSDQRYDRLFNVPLLDSGARIANRAESGVQQNGLTSGGSVLDRFRSIYDRDRRDDSTFWNNRYVDTSGYLRQGNDFFSRLDRFFNGRNAGAARWDQIYGVSGISTGGTSTPTDRSGRTVTYQSTSRTGLQPAAAGTTASANDELAKATAARKAAYERLVKALEAPQSSPAAPGTSVLQSDEVQEAIRAYKEADRVVKEITGRLQANEKQ